MSTTKARFVFVGNIPYGLTEEQITGIFGTAGQVANFRLVHDKDTGRPKGFGFLEYSDPDAAATAVRNLDQYEVMGRKLRVDFTNESGASEGATKDQPLPTMTGGAPDGVPAGQPGSLPPLPPGQDLPQGISCEDAISRTLAAVPGPQLLDILSTMKGVVASEPQKATELLSKAPQLSYAIFQSLLLLGLVDTQVLQGVLGQAQQSHVGGAAPPPPQQQQPPAPPSSMPPAGQSQFAPPGQYPGQPMQPHMNTMTPPVQNQYQHPPPAAAAAAPTPASQQQEVLVQKIMSMSQQELDALAPEVRSQVYALRQQFMGAQA